MLQIKSPVKNYTGISANIGFAKGIAIVNKLSPTQKAYFEKKGYEISEFESDAKNVVGTNIESNKLFPPNDEDDSHGLNTI